MADAEDVKEAVQDVLDSRREFTLETSENEIFHYFIANPSGEDIRKADWRYSKIYNQAIVDDFLTQSQMTELLKKKGIIDDEYTQTLEDVRIALGAELFKLENVLGKEGPTDDREVCALEVSRLRDELFQLNQRVNGPMASTCEYLAEDARTDFLTSRIIQNKDGSKLWEIFEDFRNEENTALAIKARFEVMLWMQGLESNFIENTPEQATLREIAQKRFEAAIENASLEVEADSAEELTEQLVNAEDGVVLEPENLETPEVVEEHKPKQTRAKKASVKKKTAPARRKAGRPRGSKNKDKVDPPKDE